MWSNVISIDKGFGREIEFILAKLQKIRHLSFAVEESRDRVFFYIASVCEMQEEVEGQVRELLQTVFLVFMKLRFFLGALHNMDLNHANCALICSLVHFDSEYEKGIVSRVLSETCDYAVDGSLTLRINPESGKPREYRADPYQMTYRNGMYYLLCHMHGKNGVAFAHVDRIRDLRIVEGLRQECPLEQLRASDGSPFSLADYLAERLYPWTGQAEDILMHVGSLACIYDWFERPSVSRVDAHTYEVAVRADPQTVLWWALQYADNVDIDILKPQSLRDAMAAVGRRLVERYGSDADDGAD